MRALLVGILTLILATPVAAGELAGVTLPDSAQVDGRELTLNGMALRKKLFIKVYVAGLYLPQKMSDASAVLSGDTARHLKMEFVRGVGKDKMCDAWYEGLEANTENPSTELTQKFDQLCDWMIDVEEGGTFAFTYVPGEGTTVEVDGETQGSIEGKDFADALFASWIGPNPGPGDDFREALMGNA